MVDTQSEMVGCFFYALKIPYFWIIVILYDKTLDKGVIILYLCRKNKYNENTKSKTGIG